MSASTGPLPEIASVVECDPGLWETLPAGTRKAALLASRARVARIEPGARDLRRAADLSRGGHGLFVLGGVLIRRVAIMGRVASELIGPGDLLRPQDGDGRPRSLDVVASWEALGAVRLAVLDHAWSVRMSAFPAIAVVLSGRAVKRSRRLANSLAIASHPRLDERLWLLLWDLADRHGVIHPRGVHVRLRLTDDMLAELAAARRPSVSTALRRMADAGMVARMEHDGWLLRGDPPAYNGEDLVSAWPG
jgi:CRP-like cAMP-binding protein